MIWFCLVAHPTIARVAKMANIVGVNLIGALSTTLTVTKPRKKNRRERINCHQPGTASAPTMSFRRTANGGRTWRFTRPGGGRAISQKPGGGRSDADRTAQRSRDRNSRSSSVRGIVLKPGPVAGMKWQGLQQMHKTCFFFLRLQKEADR